MLQFQEPAAATRAQDEVRVVLRTSGLSKRFGEIQAVDGLDLEVRAGEVFGFLGPNGSGKSTTVGMILGLIEPTAGSAAGGFFERLPEAFLSENVQTLLTMGGSAPADEVLPGTWQAVGVLGAYIVAFTAIAFWRFARRDVTSS